MKDQTTDSAPTKTKANPQFTTIYPVLRDLQSQELELELIQYQMTQKPMLRCEVGARSLRASSHA